MIGLSSFVHAHFVIFIRLSMEVRFQIFHILDLKNMRILINILEYPACFQIAITVDATLLNNPTLGQELLGLLPRYA